MTGSALVDLGDQPAVDSHCHPLLLDPAAVAPDAFLGLFTESRPGTMAEHVYHTAYFRRALDHLAARYETEVTIGAVLEGRRRLGTEASHRALAEGRVTALLVDTGYPPEAMALNEMRRILPCAIHEVFRIETCAEALLAADLSYADFVSAFQAALLEACRDAVALKSIIAYRSGLAIRAWNPEDAALAYRGAVARVQAGGPPRLTEKPLLDTLVRIALDVCRDAGRPLQLHTGFGDPDVDLPQANPLLLRPILEDARWAQVRIVALHMAYPYFREAAFMAAAWPQLYLDLSLALPFLGPGSILPLVEVLSLAPSSKLLYGSDLGGLPELLAFAAQDARTNVGEALDWLVARRGITTERARQIGRQLFTDNAIALYALPA
jgi:predicted TIM-barrel fold metal-dependent hydrolase